VLPSKIEAINEPIAWPALACAAFYGRFEVINALLKAGATVDMKDATYQGTPLGWAGFGNVPESARILLRHGADPTIKNASGDSVREFVSGPIWEEVLSTVIQNTFQGL